MNTIPKIAIFCSLLVLSQDLLSQQTDLQEENLKGHVYSVTTREYGASEKFGEETKGALLSISKSWYNPDGNMNKWKYYGEMSERVESYDNGDVVYIIEELNLESYVARSYEYDDSGRLVNIRQIHPESYIINSYEYVYDRSGKLTETNVFDSNGYLETKRKYEYSQNEETCKIYNSYGELEGTILTTIDAKGGKTVLTTSEGRAAQEEYDSNGRQIKEIHEIVAQNGIVGVETYYVYNNFGDLISMTGDIAMAIDYNRESHKAKNYYKYEYDDHKNWIVRKSYENNKIESWTEREIVYGNSKSELERLYVQEKRGQFVKDSLEKRQMFVADSIKQRQQFVKDSLETRKKFVQDSLANCKKEFVEGLSGYLNMLTPNLKNKVADITAISSDTGGCFVFESKKGHHIGPVKFANELIWNPSNDRVISYVNEDRNIVVLSIFKTMILLQYDSVENRYLMFELSKKCQTYFMDNIGAIHFAFQNVVDESMLDKKPTFRGGDVKNFAGYINNELRSLGELYDFAYGDFTFQFTVDEEGKVCNLYLLKGNKAVLNNDLSSQSTRTLPDIITGYGACRVKLTPAILDGRPIPVAYTLKINIKKTFKDMLLNL